jgi:hypothetical protein
MTANAPISLLASLSTVPDPRSAHGRRHPLSEMLAAGCCAILCGARGFKPIAQWLHDQDIALAHALGFTRKPPKWGPSASCSSRWTRRPSRTRWHGGLRPHWPVHAPGPTGRLEDRAVRLRRRHGAIGPEADDRHAAARVHRHELLLCWEILASSVGRHVDAGKRPTAASRSTPSSPAASRRPSGKKGREGTIPAASPSSPTAGSSPAAISRAATSPSSGRTGRPVASRSPDAAPRRATLRAVCSSTLPGWPDTLVSIVRVDHRPTPDRLEVSEVACADKSRVPRRRQGRRDVGGRCGT